MQCLQDPNHKNSDNLNKVRYNARRHFRNKKKEYLKAKIDELETNSRKYQTCVEASVTFKKVFPA